MSAPVFTVGIVHGDEGPKPGVLYRGVYLCQPSKLLARFLASAEAGDWFAPRAAELADELRDAISVVEGETPYTTRNAA